MFGPFLATQTAGAAQEGGQQRENRSTNHFGAVSKLCGILQEFKPSIEFRLYMNVVTNNFNEQQHIDSPLRETSRVMMSTERGNVGLLKLNCKNKKLILPPLLGCDTLCARPWPGELPKVSPAFTTFRIKNEEFCCGQSFLCRACSMVWLRRCTSVQLFPEGARHLLISSCSDCDAASLCVRSRALPCGALPARFGPWLFVLLTMMFIVLMLQCCF